MKRKPWDVIQSVEDMATWAKSVVPASLASAAFMLYDSDTWNYSKENEQWSLVMRFCIEFPPTLAWIMTFAEGASEKNLSAAITNGTKLVSMAMLCLKEDDDGRLLYPPEYKTP